MATSINQLPVVPVVDSGRSCEASTPPPRFTMLTGTALPVALVPMYNSTGLSLILVHCVLCCNSNTVTSFLTYFTQQLVSSPISTMETLLCPSPSAILVPHLSSLFFHLPQFRQCSGPLLYAICGEYSLSSQTDVTTITPPTLFNKSNQEHHDWEGREVLHATHLINGLQLIPTHCPSTGLRVSGDAATEWVCWFIPPNCLSRL